MSRLYSNSDQQREQKFSSYDYMDDWANRNRSEKEKLSGWEISNLRIVNAACEVWLKNRGLL